MLYRSIIRPLLFLLPPEAAHETALHLLGASMPNRQLRRLVRKHFNRSRFGPLSRFGLTFDNPVGLAAGFDKNGALAPHLAALGFGFIEIGTVTRLPQPGNPRPRIFRLSSDQALINRSGFNNNGAATAARHLQGADPVCPVGINIGKSRVVAIDDATNDYLASFNLVYDCADYMVINVSSPNTPGLRELQNADRLAALLRAIADRNQQLARRTKRAPLPLLVKISPDMTRPETEAAVDIAISMGFKGIIATNTTVSREALVNTPAQKIAEYGAGGLSGKPLRRRSTQVVAEVFQLARGRLHIIGVGGIFTAEDAWEKICAGASLVQIYTGLIYQGFSMARDINDRLVEIAHQEGFHSLDEAVGSRARALSGQPGS